MSVIICFNIVTLKNKEIHILKQNSSFELSELSELGFVSFNLI